MLNLTITNLQENYKNIAEAYPGISMCTILAEIGQNLEIFPGY